MQQNGIIPNKDILYNVDHIIDRHVGGANTPFNFIIMPENINKLKDCLKALQIKAYGPESDQEWFLTWVPDGYIDGEHAPVLV